MQRARGRPLNVNGVHVALFPLTRGLEVSSADRRFCGPRLFRGYHRHRTVFYRGVETPASFSFRSIFLYRRAPDREFRN